LKIYLDDERPIPDGWHGCRWPEEVIRLLKAGEVTHLSLDHDLGDDSHGTGYDVVLWIEEQVATTNFQRQLRSREKSRRVDHDYLDQLPQFPESRGYRLRR